MGKTKVSAKKFSCGHNFFWLKVLIAKKSYHTLFLAKVVLLAKDFISEFFEGGFFSKPVFDLGKKKLFSIFLGTFF